MHQTRGIPQSASLIIKSFVRYTSQTSHDVILSMLPIEVYVKRMLVRRLRNMIHKLDYGSNKLRLRQHRDRFRNATGHKDIR